MLSQLLAPAMTNIDPSQLLDVLLFIVFHANLFSCTFFEENDLASLLFKLS
jgi:hypothetical protein